MEFHIPRTAIKRVVTLAGLLFFAAPLVAWGEDSFPRPYIYKDRGLGKEASGFTLNASDRLPEWLSLAIQHRARYETLRNPFRAGTTGSDQALSLRTLAQATLHLHPDFKIHLELQDSRAEFTDTGTPVSTGVVNATELLEANLQWSAKGLFQTGSHSLLRGGRLTMDIGKRRLVARNRFRNTKNAFTGVDWIWRAQNKNTFRTLFTVPVNRQPTPLPQFLGNRSEFDKETLDQIFWGLFFSTPHLPWTGEGEVYLFGLHESDGPNFTTRNRKLYTPGFRFYRPAQPDHFDYEWESVLQFGTSRATAASTDTRDLDHFAYFHHAELGYTFEVPWTPRLILAYDYASGDNNPNDGSNGRFDTLFGATVFDFGPTGIHRPFIRSNIHGPGVKVILRPMRQIGASLHYRALWLASNTDIWAGNSGLRDGSGNSGSFLGHQWFLQNQWQVLPNIQMEGGAAYRIDGDFQKSAPNAPHQGNTVYTYVSATLSF